MEVALEPVVIERRVPADLVAQSIRGDREAFAALVEPSLAAAMGAALIVCRSHADASDAVQDALLAAWQGLDRLRDPQAFPAWFRTLAVRAALRAVRRRARVVELDIAESRSSVRGPVGRASHRAPGARPRLRSARARRPGAADDAPPVGCAGGRGGRGAGHPGRDGEVEDPRGHGTAAGGVRRGGAAMTRRLEDELHDLLARRTSVDSRDLDALRTYTTRLPRRRPHQRGLLAAAAGILLVLSMGGLLATRIQLGTSGAAPQPPDPAAFAGDPRLALCGVTPDGADAIFEMAHLRDYPLHLPAAYPLKDLQADPDAPTLVIVLRGQSSTTRLTGTPVPGTQDLCLVVGSDPATWQQVAVVGVDTSGLLAALPEPTGTPIADDLRALGRPLRRAGRRDLRRRRPRARADAGRRTPSSIPSPPEVAAGDASAVIVYDSDASVRAARHPSGARYHHRAPQPAGRWATTTCASSSAATRLRQPAHLYEDVTVTASSADPGASPSRAGPSLPAQMSAADCEAMSFAPDRCLAVVEAALAQASLGWADVAHVSIAKPQPDTTSLGSQPVAEVTFSLSDGGTRSEEVRCLMLGSGWQPRVHRPSADPALRAVRTQRRLSRRAVRRHPGRRARVGVCDPHATRSIPRPRRLPSPSRSRPTTIRSPLPVTSRSMSARRPCPTGSCPTPGCRLPTHSPGHSRSPRASRSRSGPSTRLARRSSTSTSTAGTRAPRTVEVFLVLDVTSVTRGAMLEVRDLVVR